MINFSNEQLCFLELVKSSLYNITPVINEDVDWDIIFEISKSQCVISLIESSVPSEFRHKWNDLSLQSRTHNIQLLYEQNELIKLLNKNSINLIILKGCSVAMYYPNPILRTMGDIDFYVKKDHFVKTQEILNNNGFHYISHTNRHYSYIKNGIEFELHNRIDSDYSQEFESIIAYGINFPVENQIGKYKFYSLPDLENGLVILGHIMQHLKSTGIGFRQIIDWSVFVNSRLTNDYWNNTFKTKARDAGLEKLALILTNLCKKWLYISENITWCDSADDELSDLLLQRLFLDGNFGKDRTKTEKVIENIKRDGFFSYMQNAGLQNWHLSKKYRLFRPFAWIYQIFNYAFKCIIYLFKGINIFKIGKKEVGINDLLERLE